MLLITSLLFYCAGIEIEVEIGVGTGTSIVIVIVAAADVMTGIKTIIVTEVEIVMIMKDPGDEIEILIMINKWKKEKLNLMKESHHQSSHRV